MTTKELKLLGIQNQVPNRSKASKQPCTREGSNNEDIDPISYRRHRRLVRNIVKNHRKNEVERNEPDCSNDTINVTKKRKHSRKKTTQGHVQCPQNQPRN